jgi:hypothetical protein
MSALFAVYPARENIASLLIGAVATGNSSKVRLLVLMIWVRQTEHDDRGVLDLR